jgi:hypothetical protein
MRQSRGLQWRVSSRAGYSQGSITPIALRRREKDVQEIVSEFKAA